MKTFLVPVTEFIRPNADKRIVNYFFPVALQEKYKAMKDLGLFFTYEVIPGGIHVCLDAKVDDYAMEICRNSEEALSWIAMMIENFDANEYRAWLDRNNY